MRRKAKRTPWARRRRRTYLGLALVALLLSPWLVWRLRLKADARKALEAVRAEGVPVTAEEREAMTASWPARTATPLYRDALDAYVMLPVEIVDDFPTFRPRNMEAELYTRPYPAELLAAMRKALGVNEAAVELLHEATHLPEGRYEAGMANDVFIELICAEACVKAADGDGEGALVAITGGLLYLERTSVACMTAPGWPPELLERILAALFSAASHTALPVDHLKPIRAQLDPSGWEDQYRQLSLIHAGYWLEDLSHPRGDATLQVLDIAVGIVDHQLRDTCESWRADYQLIGKTLAEQDALFAARRDRRWGRRARVAAPPVHLEVARAAIDLILFYHDHGALPAALEELVPAYRESVPMDFFTGQPLRYEPKETAFVIYSVDHDRKDDGGSGRGDIVFRADLPPR